MTGDDVDEVHRSSASPPEEPRATILLVDDDSLKRELFERFLVRQGFLVMEESSGQECLKRIGEERVDLVLLDIVLPDIDGLEVLVALRAMFSIAELPIIVVTDLDDTDSIVQALGLGANDYIIKPTDFTLIVARIETQLALKSANDQVTALNRRLERAHDRVIGLVDSASGALSDVSAWARSAAHEVAEAVSVENIGVWALEGDRLSELTNDSTAAPGIVDMAMILKGSFLERPDDTVIPVMGYDTELLGAIVVTGHEDSWAPMSRGLLDAFAMQLGGVFEVRRARRELSETRNCDENEARSGQSSAPRVAYRVQVCRLCGRCFDEEASECARCGPGSLLHSPWPVPYVLAERYRMHRVLGKGGMAMVFSAVDLRLDREVAIKVINLEFVGDRTMRARFKQEAQAVASIEDGGVVSVHDFGEVETGAFYIVMERLYGLDLEHLVRRCGPGSPREVGAFLRQGATALDAAHRAKVIHRDVKPGNFFLVPIQGHFKVKVLDFGLALRLSVRTNLTGVGTIVGTPMYMSPEQAMGKHLDNRTDLYSFAAVAFRSLAGSHYSEQKSYTGILVDVIRNPPPAISNFLSTMPRKIDKAFKWGLSKRPEDRPKSAEEWVHSFVDVLEDVPSTVDGWMTKEGLRGVKRPKDRT